MPCEDCAPIPPEPAIGTWVVDRHGGTHHRGADGGWGQPGFFYFGKWEPIWRTRGPLTECGPYGLPLQEGSKEGSNA